MMNKSGLVGKRFGRQVVLSDSNRSGYVVVQCNCGNIHEVRADTLTRDKNRAYSCGCYRRETTRDIGRNVIKRIANDKPGKRNKTGVKGVYFNESRGIYTASICLNYHNYFLGHFSNIGDAAAARKEAEDRLFAPLISAAQ